MAEAAHDMLRAFCTANPSCALLALSDLRVGTMLLAHGELTYPQEYLDAVSCFARDALTVAGAGADHMIFCTPESTRLVVRETRPSDLALTAFAPPDADPRPLLEALRQLVASFAPNALAA
ncbi:hypothetical protein HKCCE4037_12740 [Rhodobacterales bacterium HKCCE4037]|nr:hypothetical protein [Rhodobacterales bacterium HKCCE4037]